MGTEQVIVQAEKLLSDTWGQPITLHPRAPLKSNHLVLRCDVEGAAPYSTVILKHVTLDAATEKRHVWMRQRFLNECASLQFLSGLPQPFTARWLAGDVQGGLLIVEDLGDHPSVQDLAFGQDGELTRQALLVYAAALGQLQSASYGKEADFQALQTALGAEKPWCDGNTDARTLLVSMHECLAALGVTPAADFDAEVLAIGAALHDEPLFRGLCHCDAGLHNVMWLGDGQVRIVDFEFANYQHVMTDIVCARMSFPPAYHGRPLPHDIVTNMENAYRAALTNGISAAADDTQFYDALLAAVGHWAISELGLLWDFYLKERLRQGASYDEQDGRTPAGAATVRNRLVGYYRAFIAASEEFDRLPAIRATLLNVIPALHRHWDNIEPMPSYPALPIS